MPRLAHPLPPTPPSRPSPEFDVRTALVHQRQSGLIADAEAHRLRGPTGRDGSPVLWLRSGLGRLLVAIGTWLEPSARPVVSPDSAGPGATIGN